MFRVLVYFLICGMFLSGLCVDSKTVEPVVSTQGLNEMPQEVAKSAKTTFKENQKYNKKRKTSKDYIKAKKQIRKMDELKTKKQRELEFLQNKMDKKKEKLEVLTSED